MANLEYQNNLSLHSPILLDAAYKRSKVEKMIAVLRDAGVISDTPRPLAVDIGCSRGFFTLGLAPYFRHVLGIDIDTHALALAQAENVQSNIGFFTGDSLRMPLPDCSVDLVICNHVYEHVPDPERLFDEIHRILKTDGRCYLGAASRLTLVEPHYHLPFLSWLPKRIAHRYMRLAGKGDRYYENLRTYGGIRRLLGRFQIEDYTLKIVGDPDKYRARDVLPEHGLLAMIPLKVWKMLYRSLPTYILILKKRL